MTSLNQSWALIVGGSSGMGYSVAKQLLQSGIATLIVGNDEISVSSPPTLVKKPSVSRNARRYSRRQ